MEVRVWDDLGGSGAVVLYDVPVRDAGGTAKGEGDDAQVVAQVAGLAGLYIGDFGAMGARAEEDVATAQGEDVEEGDE